MTKIGGVMIMKSHFKTLELEGYITAANVAEFQQALTQSVKTLAYNRYLVDMKGVEFLDSAGLMALVTTFRLAQSLNKQFCICSLAPSVRIIFELTQLDKIIPIYDNKAHFIGEINPLAVA